MTIVGLDVCQDRAVAWELLDFPRNPKNYWKEQLKIQSRNKDPLLDPQTFFVCQRGIDQLKKSREITVKAKLLKDLFTSYPEIEGIVLEPTGMHYSRIIAKAAEKAQIKIYWVGHQQSRHYRAGLKLPDKNDLADAFALAHYTLTYQLQENYFLEFKQDTSRIKELFLESKFLSKIQTAQIARLKQQLSYEWPEQSQATIKEQKDGRRPLIVWLSARDWERNLKRRSKFYSEYAKSVSHDYGIEISQFTRNLASQIDDQDIWQAELKTQLQVLVYAKEFETYNQIFDEFKFHLGLRAILLNLAYPFSRFDCMGGFKKRIGSAQREESSGNTSTWKTGDGSKLARTELFLWTMNQVINSKSNGDSDVLILIKKRYLIWKEMYGSNAEEYIKKYQEQTIIRLEKKVEDLLTMTDFDATLLTRLENILASLKTLKCKETTQINNQNSKKFGILILNKTIGYTARLLYRRLRDSIKT